MGKFSGDPKTKWITESGADRYMVNNRGQSKILKAWQTRHNRLRLLSYQTPETAIQQIVTGR